MKSKKLCAVGLAAMLALMSLTACGTGTAAGNAGSASSEAATETAETAGEILTEADITVNETLEDTSDGGHVIEADGQEVSYSNIKVVKSGEASGDEADFYGENAAIFATNGAAVTLSDMVVTTDGTHANGVFSYGEGTVVNISHSVIETTGNCSGGLMTTGGGTMNASDLTIHTTGNSSAAIRSDRGGGTVTVTGGNYTTDGTGSPVIYSTADITVSDAVLTSTASQGVVVEGKNSVTLRNVQLTADNNTKNSDKSEYYQAVMIYQSMSGDAAEGASSFTMEGGTLTNRNGDILFVNNTVTEITLHDVEIINEDADGVFLRAAAAGWGNEGSNGGQVTMNAEKQEINGDMVVDDISVLNLSLADGSVLNGAINAENSEGQIYVELTGGSKWVLTADSYITSLTCDTDSIDLNGHTLYVGGEAYQAGTASTGEAIEITVTSSGGGMPEGMPGGQDGAPPEKPDGELGPGSQNGTPPEKPDGEGGPGAEGGTPSAKPGD
ncbi:MAG: hypothetical protein IJH77_03410 [Mogibacterium sp.]|nr:hypothetical protein [Mogibacterium sp.]